MRISKKIFVYILGVGNDQFWRWMSFDSCASSSFNQDSSAIDTTDTESDPATPEAHTNIKMTYSKRLWKKFLKQIIWRSRVKVWKKTRVVTKGLKTLLPVNNKKNIHGKYFPEYYAHVQRVQRLHWKQYLSIFNQSVAKYLSLILKQSNISIHEPPKDQCEVCCMHEVGTIEEAACQWHILKKNLWHDAKNEASCLRVIHMLLLSSSFIVFALPETSSFLCLLQAKVTSA